MLQRAGNLGPNGGLVDSACVSSRGGLSLLGLPRGSTPRRCSGNGYLRADSEKLGVGDQDGDEESQRAPLSVKKVSDDEWRVLLDGKAEGELIPGNSSTKALFWLVRQQGQEFISVARGGTDPLEIKKEMVDQGRAAEQPAFISVLSLIHI